MTASTPPWPRLRNVGSVQLMTQLGTELGLTVPQCLAQTGLDVMALADGQAQVEAAQELQVVSNLLAGLPEQPLLGLLAGRRYQLSRYGIWGYALLCSASLGEALDMGLRYLDLTFAFCRIHARKDASGHWLVVDDSWVEPSVRRFLLLRDSSAIARIHRELTGLRQPFKSVQLALPAPPVEQLAAFTEAYGCTPQFNAQEHLLELDPELLARALPGDNPAMREACELQCHQLLQRYRARDGLAGRVRELLLEGGAALPDMPTVAARLHLTERTLRRRLGEEQTSFRQLQEETREALAEELLRMPGLSLEAVAVRLGYGEVSNFVHAFRRWKGMTPRQYCRSERV
ncbi:transcriptional regulator [Halopseudomonas aestusnigri]|uniref:AraC family transcriptional regulator n=1 Tax=Halopseudomonas TaxID=2901189 RepID=UPI0022B6BBB8|nr:MULTISPECIES: AraC family transcriptional regulator [Halopseudomonas]BDX17820.1 transcriptional regulator [Halopseudomonas aestusnigri]